MDRGKIVLGLDFCYNNSVSYFKRGLLEDFS